MKAQSKAKRKAERENAEAIPENVTLADLVKAINDGFKSIRSLMFYIPGVSERADAKRAKDKADKAAKAAADKAATADKAE